ncbi:MAG: hypothetical protein ACRDY0_12715, partial [Acidimicrobiales bacterium]
LSYVYSAEWPAFALVAVVGWWQLVQEDPAEVEARRQERRRRGRANPVAFDEELLRRELQAHPELVRTFPELARAFPELGPASGAGAPAVLVGHRPGEEVAVGAKGDHGGQGDPDGARGVGSSGGGDGATPLPSEELRAYNDALSALAARGKAKSWRNPHGR